MREMSPHVSGRYIQRRRSAAWAAEVACMRAMLKPTITAAVSAQLLRSRLVHACRARSQTSRWIPATVKHDAAIIEQMMVIQFIRCGVATSGVRWAAQRTIERVDWRGATHAARIRGAHRREATPIATRAPDPPVSRA